VKPFNEDLESRVAVVFAPRVDLVRVCCPIRRLLVIGDIEVPSSEAGRPFRAGLSGVVDAYRAPNDDDEQRHDDKQQRER